MRWCALHRRQFKPFALWQNIKNLKLFQINPCVYSNITVIMRPLILNKEVILEELAPTANGPSFGTRKSYKWLLAKLLTEHFNSSLRMVHNIRLRRDTVWIQIFIKYTIPFSLYNGIKDSLSHNDVKEFTKREAQSTTRVCNRTSMGKTSINNYRGRSLVSLQRSRGC